MLKLNRRWPLGARLLTLLCSGFAICTAGAVGAGSAQALGEQCSGNAIEGQGSFLQGRAQLVWTGKEKGFNGSSVGTACNGSQGSGGKPKVTFAPVGSGAALHAWGADDGVFHGKGVSFLATDEPPAGPVGEEGTQLQLMKEAIGSDVVVAPVTQTAIAIAANPPSLPAHSACVVGQITQGDLEQVFDGSLTNWRQLSTASDQEAGGDCDQAITRVVREDLSGTTYQFKHYLDQIDSEPLECTGESSKTWAQLQSSREPGKWNMVWPRKADCQEGEGPVTVVAAPGKGSAEALGFVQKNPGTITYGDLPTAEQVAPEAIVKVHNGAAFAAPSAGGGKANCWAAKYTLPSEWATGLNLDWSQVYGSDPEIGKKEGQESAYPLCSLTWAIAAADSGGVFGTKAGTTIRDYLLYVIDAEGGQSDLTGHSYAPLPVEVAEAAAAAVSKIGGEGEEEEGGEEEVSGTRLCEVAPEANEGVLDCPAGKGYAGVVSGTLLKTTQLKSVGSPTGVITCNEADLVGKFNEDGTALTGSGVPMFTFGSSSGPCTSTLAKLPKMKTELSNTPLDGSKILYLAELAPQGSFVFAKAKGGAPQLHAQAEEGAPNCFYQASFFSGQVVNGSPTALSIVATWDLLEGSEACPVKLTQTAELGLRQLESEASVYVAGE